MNDVDHYLHAKLMNGYRPRAICGVCSALRTLFLFADAEGWNTTKVAWAIRRPRVPRGDKSPTGPAWSDVRRLVEHDFGSTQAAIRADAIVALSAIYGFRSCEIIRMKLGDFDWVNEILTVTRAKSRKVQQLPIQIEAGEKIIRYLKHARPKCSCRHLFVTLKPPFRPVDGASLWVVVASRLKVLEIESKSFGTHALRHACATHLLHEGTPLADIAHYLGHSDLKSVSVYAKHDLEALKRVAEMSLAAIL